MKIGDILNNRTLSDMFEVANTGGIRVSRANNHIVLVSNPGSENAYQNNWKGGTLHFVGRGCAGPQKLSRQNATLANSKRSGARIYLFEATGKGQYTYRGEVELSGKPYIDAQPDDNGQQRFVWIFPLTRATEPDASARPSSPAKQYLPVGTYAVIGDQLDPDQRVEVDRRLDDLRALGVPVVSQRDVEAARYEVNLARWYDKALSSARRAVREIVRRQKREAKERGQPFAFAPDEVELPDGCDEQLIVAVLDTLGMAEVSSKIFQEARDRRPMPELPCVGRSNTDGDLVRLPKKPKSSKFDWSEIT